MEKEITEKPKEIEDEDLMQFSLLKATVNLLMLSQGL
jgi:hypothetical protein